MDERDRAAFLDHACGEDAALRQEVESLLAFTGNTAGFIEEPVAQAARQWSGHASLIGPWRILEPLGDGGMGSVYLACRADELYEQRVAIKLMRAELVRNREMLLRFRRERQILANLNHPNIARLLDGGVSAEGLPYLVMEYVEGLPIHEYCAQNKLALTALLELFRTVCTAVEYAHQRFVIHRDLKPANILVTSNGVAKLLDFGIARLLDPDLEANETQTRASERIMTPEYASPEQIRGEAVTTSTDVYSMGILLYELLASSRPFRPKTDSPLEMAMAICEQTPLVPSAVCKDVTRARHLRGDLDRIVMMAIRKEPERRYSSIAQFSSDITSYLNGYPLLARTDTLGYRTSTFVRRHKLGVGVAALFILSLIGFGIGMGLLARQAQREKETADQEKQFMADMFQAATPEEARGQTITARMLLDRGAQRIDHELAGQPRVRSSLLETIAQAYRSLGFFDQAQSLAQRSIALDPKNPDKPKTLELLAELARDKGQYATAEPLLASLINTKSKTLGATNPEVAGLMGELGECFYWEAKDDQALDILRRTLAIDQKNGPLYGESTRNYLALVLERKGDYDEARHLLEDSLEISRKRYGVESPDYGNVLHNLGSSLIDRGDLFGAEAKLREALTSRRRILGPDHPDLLYTLNNLAFVLLEEGNWRAAEPFAKEAVDNGLKRLGPDHPRTAGPMNNYARVLEAKGDYAQAAATYKHILEILDKAKADKTWPAAQVTANLGLLYFDRGDYSVAEEEARKAMAIRTMLGGTETPAFANSLIEVAEDRAFQGDLADAEPLLRQAMAIREKRFASGHPAIITAKVRLGEVLVAEGKAAEAEPLLKDAVNAAEHSAFPLPNWEVAEAKSAYGECRKAQGKSGEAPAIRELAADPRPAFRGNTVSRLAAIWRK
jgi:serine/threonine-protein kinase